MAMMRHIVGAACGLWVGCGTVALAESEQGVLVELYTSQGCSSCPPADDVLTQIAAQPGIIALSLHVDYWDYIGWKDTFGQAKFSDRQRAYAQAAGEKMIYTPQIIVAGDARVEGNRPDRVAEAIDQASRISPVTLQLSRVDGKILIDARTDAVLPRDAVVQLVGYIGQADVEIRQGENAGKTVTYSNVATSWDVVGHWSGAEPLAISVDAPEGPVVVIIQAAGPQQVLATARLK